MEFSNRGLWIYRESVFSYNHSLFPLLEPLSSNHCWHLFSSINLELFDFLSHISEKEIFDFRGGIFEVGGEEDKKESTILKIEGFLTDDKPISYFFNTIFDRYENSRIVSKIKCRVSVDSYSDVPLEQFLIDPDIRFTSLNFSLEEYSCNTPILKWFGIPAIQGAISLSDQDLNGSNPRRQIFFKHTKNVNPEFFNKSTEFIYNNIEKDSSLSLDQFKFRLESGK